MRTVEIRIVKDHRKKDLISAIPSTYKLCRMYDNKSTQLQITSSDDIELKDYDIYLRMISGNVDLGRVFVAPNTKRLIHTYDDSIYLVDELSEILENEAVIYTTKIPRPTHQETYGDININTYYYELSAMYTKNPKLGIQVILVDSEGFESRTNIINFELSNSLPLDREFFQNISYLERLVYDKKIILQVDNEDKKLIILDDLENELCSIDIRYMLGGDWINEDQSIWIRD